MSGTAASIKERTVFPPPDLTIVSEAAAAHYSTWLAQNPKGGFYRCGASRPVAPRTALEAETVRGGAQRNARLASTPG